jgi:hypothetical protein
MKKIGEYTTRGQVSEDETEEGNPQKIELFDGRFDTGYRITDFKIWTSNVLAGTAAAAKLATTDTSPTARSNFFNAHHNDQIAWAVTEMQTDGGHSGGFADSIVDPDNMVIEDLYVYVRCETHETPINYMITMEKYDITDWQGALSMVRNRSQA